MGAVPRCPISGRAASTAYTKYRCRCETCRAHERERQAAKNGTPKRRAQQREAARRHYWSDPQRSRDRSRNWARSNPGIVSASRRAYQRAHRSELSAKELERQRRKGVRPRTTRDECPVFHRAFGTAHRVYGCRCPQCVTHARARDRERYHKRPKQRQPYNGVWAAAKRREHGIPLKQLPRDDCPVYHRAFSTAYRVYHCRCPACREHNTLLARLRYPRYREQRDLHRRARRAELTAQENLRRATKIGALPDTAEERAATQKRELELRAARHRYTAVGLATHVDHIIPLSRGGRHCASNLRLITASANSRKRNRLDSELDFVIEALPA